MPQTGTNSSGAVRGKQGVPPEQAAAVMLARESKAFQMKTKMAQLAAARLAKAAASISSGEHVDDDADAGSTASVASVDTAASVDTRVDDSVPAPRFQQVVVAREGVIAEHSCGKREKCLLCGALVWKEEDRNQLCCGRGKYILGPDLLSFAHAHLPFTHHR